MLLFKKVKDVTVLDVYVGYGCNAVLMCIVGGVAYTIGKRKGASKEKDRLNKEKIGYYDEYRKYRKKS